MSLASATFAVFLLIMLALATNLLLASSLGEFASKLLHAGTIPLNANDPRAIIYDTPGSLLLAMMILIALAGWGLSLLINTNRFSLHYYWRNRMMRAYLGATRSDEDRERTRNKFTNFDESDNLRMFRVLQKPLHVINVTLNLVGGDKLAWQDRKAESFTMSPLHCGSYWLGYRKSEIYAQNRKHEGISLATAAAISGAAASPNMGYMMTSPIARFLMTLFNLRLGFLLGNPGPDGGEAYKRDSPGDSIGPILEEALGQTDDKKPYVYLSDGGHFENFGLYEMILRRCRFIVIGDGSSDETYGFGSLGLAIRQIRVDFGVPIDMGEMQFGNRPKDGNNYCAVGVIRY